MTLVSLPADVPLIFLLSTYGEGDPSDDATVFYRWITSARITTRLSDDRYAAFGLGNSTYLRFNGAVSLLVQQLDSRKAVRIGPIGLGDAADGSTEETFLAWQEEIVDILQKHLSITQQTIPAFCPTVKFDPRIH
ncbi:hypothetical protein N7490_007554 [Penicillium lividum]|nr:hypothetical protein N7490_007554 [Penicillium lividum]